MKYTMVVLAFKALRDECRKNTISARYKKNKYRCWHGDRKPNSECRADRCPIRWSKWKGKKLK